MPLSYEDRGEEDGEHHDECPKLWPDALRDLGKAIAISPTSQDFHTKHNSSRNSGNNRRHLEHSHGKKRALLRPLPTKILRARHREQRPMAKVDQPGYDKCCYNGHS